MDSPSWTLGGVGAGHGIEELSESTHTAFKAMGSGEISRGHVRLEELSETRTKN